MSEDIRPTIEEKPEPVKIPVAGLGNLAIDKNGVFYFELAVVLADGTPTTVVFQDRNLSKLFAHVRTPVVKNKDYYVMLANHHKRSNSETANANVETESTGS